MSGEYGRVVKYLGLLGGAQGVSLLVNLLRNKVASTLLGTIGLGLIGLYNRTVQMFSDCTNLSLSYSAVRKLSDTYENATDADVAHYVKVTRSIALLTGIIGMLLFVIFSPLVMEYISDGSDDTVDVIKEFEALTGIKVEYTTFDSNESLYAKLKNGSASYDVIIPSDYMVSRLKEEGMLQKLDYSNIPNFEKYVDAEFKNPGYDPTNEYSVPYMWGTVGIIYNTKYVDEADVTGWELLWNEKYAGKILAMPLPLRSKSSVIR